MKPMKMMRSHRSLIVISGVLLVAAAAASLLVDL
jgi:hypothetical protein